MESSSTSAPSLEKPPKFLSAARWTDKHAVGICSLQIQAFKHSSSSSPRRRVFQTTQEICFHDLKRRPFPFRRKGEAAPPGPPVLDSVLEADPPVLVAGY